MLSDALELAIPVLPDAPSVGEVSGDAADTLGDAEVLALADLQLPPAQDARLSELLDRQQAGQLSDAERVELSGLLGLYRRGLLRKAQALAEAGRGLRPALVP